ncbi:hypothetical protein [Pandoraea apista]|uniref:hypothetical protein n=1 Tax=Pandoraea apista TaxID=93218 RepID=UPI000F68C80E|nr:hypothetical protein [Pandoraea apista]RRW89173.1 hypothetical protein EGJ54_23745 [Pandoraea apista]RRW98967.1 hypothetical protein EGJ56_22615 [Pandoraea apista]
MARKPAHIEMAGGKGPRQRAWEAIRQNAADFTVREIAMKSGADNATVRTYVQSLERASVIEAINAPKVIGERKHYRLARNTGVEAPRVDRQGKPVTASRGNENMWRSMRIMKEFTPQHLAQHASNGDVSVSEGTARAYAQALARAGYLSVVDPGHSFIRGKGAKQARYMFVPSRNTGPRPPMIQRKRSIYDPNLGKVVWQEAPDHDE